MKKIIVILMLIVASLNVSLAQNYVERSIENIQNGEYLDFCGDEYDGIIIHGRSGCQNEWTVDNLGYFIADYIVLDNTNVNLYEGVGITHLACQQYTVFFVQFWDSYIENPFPESIIWKRQGKTVKLGNEYPGIYEYLWSNDSTNCEIEVIEPGIYSVTMNQIYGCGSETFSVEVHDNVELYRATCDLRNNLNQVTWLTTPAQAEYISAVNIYRNTNQLVGTVPYLDGSFTDDIGSESTQWQYHVVGVDNEGNECPIPSYWKRTIHLDHIQGTGGGEILQWTLYEEENPSKDVVIAYGIYDIVNGEPNHVIDVGNFTNVYTIKPNDFNGQGAVAAIFEGKSRDLDDLAFSNLTEEVLNVGENSLSSFNIYPNPSNGRITIRGTGMLTISNMIGQIIFQQEIDGESFVELPAGVYVAKLGNSKQKVVVE